MYRLTIVLSNQATFQMSYKTLESATKMHSDFEESMRFNSEGDGLPFLAVDDFGHELCVRPSAVDAVMLANVGTEFDAGIENKVIEQRAQQKLNNKLQSDPSLKLAVGGMQ